MKQLIKETCRTVKSNVTGLLGFELFLRLFAVPLYLAAIRLGLEFSLKQAGYSYLTPDNLAEFLLRPWTLVALGTLAAIGIFLLAVEMGGLLACFQGIIHGQRLGVWEMLREGARGAAAQMKKGSWQLFLLLLADHLLMYSFFIFRVFARIKPLNFILEEIVKDPARRIILMGSLALTGVLAAPGLFAVHFSMLEGNGFRESMAESRALLGKRKRKAIFAAVFPAVSVSLGAVLGYLSEVAAAAVVIVKFSDRKLALASFSMMCQLLEMVMVFAGGILLIIAETAAVTVVFYEEKRDGDLKVPVRLKQQGEWKLPAAAGAVLVIISCLLVRAAMVDGSMLADDLLTEVQITAHRGSSFRAPENTLEAVAAAIEDMADFAEIDVQVTADGAMVVCHDASLKRTAGINRLVASLTLGEIEGLDAGGWFSGQFRGARIPLLSQVMESAKGNINLNIELKDLGADSNLPERIVQMIEEMEMEEQVVVSSTRFSYLRRIRQLNPDICTGYIVSAAYGNYYSSEFIDFISIRSSFVTPRLVELAHENGKAIHAWTVNTESELERMKLLQVDNVITDHPVKAREVIYEEAAERSIFEYIKHVLD